MDGKATVLVDYFTDLEDNNAIANFSFNQLYIGHDSIAVNFTVVSEGLPLVVSEESSLTRGLNYIVIVVAGMGVFLLVFGSCFCKMIGI